MVTIAGHVKQMILLGLLSISNLVVIVNYLAGEDPAWMRTLAALPFILFMFAGWWVWTQPSWERLRPDEVRVVQK